MCRITAKGRRHSSAFYKNVQPSLPGLAVYLYGLILRRTRGNSWKKQEEPEDKNPHFLYTRLILDLMRLLVNCWSPLTHCMTTAASQMRVRVITAMQPKVFLCWMSFLPEPSQFLGWRGKCQQQQPHHLRSKPSLADFSWHLNTICFNVACNTDSVVIHHRS